MTNLKTNSNLEYVVGNMLVCYDQLVPETIQTSAEITTERRLNPLLEDRDLLTSNFTIFGRQVLYFGGREANPILNDVRNAAYSFFLEVNNKFTPPDTRFADIILSTIRKNTIMLNYSDLSLSEREEGNSRLFINTSNPPSLGSADRVLAEKVFGEGDDFMPNMNMLAARSIYSTQILLPEKKKIEKMLEFRDRVVGAVYISNLRDKSIVDLSRTNMFKTEYTMRGRPRQAFVGEAYEGSDYTFQGIVNFLEQHQITDQDIASDLLNAVNAFYYRKVQ
jgi:hypothetical protein